MKQSTEHNQEFSVSRKLSLKKIGPLIFELSGLKQTDKTILNCQNVFYIGSNYIGCSFKFILKVGVEELIVNTPRITNHGSAV
jgi:hypothetical protein